MKKNFCDLCTKEIRREEDIRYINIMQFNPSLKGTAKERTPIMKEKECCVFCAKKVFEIIQMEEK